MKRMVRKKKETVAVIETPLVAVLPGWAVRTLTTIGMGTLIYGLIRYTFIGEIFERLYRNTIGGGTLDDKIEDKMEDFGDDVEHALNRIESAKI